MKLYPDDDCVKKVLFAQLRRAGHDVRLPEDVGLAGKDDAVHLRHAVVNDRVFLARNYEHFANLHNLMIDSSGHHHGIFVILQDSNPKHNLSAFDTVRAIAKVLAAGVSVADQYIVLNHWR
jgi:hypothetical protein